MPYNINPPCLAGQKTNITWQFPGQAQKSTDLGDDYNVSISIPSSAPRVNAIISADITLALEDGHDPNFAPPSGVQQRQDTVFRVRTLPANVTVNTFTALPAGELPRQYRFECTKYSSATGSSKQTDQVVLGAESYSGIYITSFSNIVVTLSSPTSNNPQINYEFRVFKNNQVVLTDTGSAQPNVTYTCGVGCPSNTCDVLCGNTICCYNSDGISVFNYPNT
jgi:hypothetical protein